jgi:hypothetical protein
VHPPEAQVLEPTLVKARRGPAGQEPFHEECRVRGPEPEQDRQRQRCLRPAWRCAEAWPVDQDEPPVPSLEQLTSRAPEAVERFRAALFSVSLT